MSASAMRAGDVYLPPGLLFAATAPCVISTVLGSCVAVSLWSRRLECGGMNHYLLPRGAAMGGESSARFGETALDLLLARMQALGAHAHELEARVYGGASVVPTLTSTAHLGEQNVEVARRFLGELRIPVVDECVLGRSARRVIFDIATGDARVVRLETR
jgi:chemotaxis protein CheD